MQNYDSGFSKSFRRSVGNAALRSGDCLSQKEFHRLYEKESEDFRAELLDGTVFVCQPLSEEHGVIHPRLGSIFDAYAGQTPGLQAYIEPTVILSEDDEVQPDLLIRILPNYKGQTSDQKARYGRYSKGTYIKGAPELVAEISFSSRSIDLHIKRRRYELAGVLEYLVVCLENAPKISWFDLPAAAQIEASDDGIFRSKMFPGLWIHERGLFDMDYKLVMDTINEGVASAEHKQFVSKLESRRII